MNDVTTKLCTSLDISGIETFKIPNNNKLSRYYYRNREKILEQRRVKKLNDPEYLKKQEEKEQRKIERGIERSKAKEEALFLKMKEKEQKIIEAARRKEEKLLAQREKRKMGADDKQKKTDTYNIKGKLISEILEAEFKMKLERTNKAE
jgi:hypothetical protein